jgi:hypothetical protein
MTNKNWFFTGNVHSIAGLNVQHSLDCLYEAKRKTGYYQMRLTGVLNQLKEVAQECTVSNWDGHNAYPVNRETLSNAVVLVETIPEELPLPTVNAAPDGSLTLEWYRNKKNIVNLNISPDKKLYFVRTSGDKSYGGEEPMMGEFPRLLETFISEQEQIDTSPILKGYGLRYSK